MCDIKIEKVLEYVDLGAIWGEKNEIADHALVLMIHGLKKTWKQPIAFYFTKGTIKRSQLKLLIAEIIVTLQGISLKVLTRIYEQGLTNRAAIIELSTDPTIGNPREFFA